MQIIPDGGSANIENAFIGLPRELRVDISNWNLRLHDGVTHGGLHILNRDNNDARYQAHSDELSGFSEAFEAADRGVLTRRGASDYRVRYFDSADGSIVLTNPDGHDGNFGLELNHELTGDYQIHGDFIVDGVVNITGGINADTSGTHFGNVVGDVQGNLLGNAHGNHTGSFTGDVDVRGHALQLDDGQIPAVKVAGFAGAISQAGVPIGGIIMFSGNAANVPANWAFCDGNNGTPNLVDRFIKAGYFNDAVISPKANEVGGTKTHGHTVATDVSGGHDHGVTVQPHALTIAEMPNHTHTLPKDLLGSSNVQSLVESTDNNQMPAGAVTGATGGDAAHSHGAAQANTGTHGHAGTTNVLNHEPQFYVLAFIMRLN